MLILFTIWVTGSREFRADNHVTKLADMFAGLIFRNLLTFNQVRSVYRFYQEWSGFRPCMPGEFDKVLLFTLLKGVCHFQIMIEYTSEW